MRSSFINELYNTRTKRKRTFLKNRPKYRNNFDEGLFENAFSFTCYQISEKYDLKTEQDLNKLFWTILERRYIDCLKAHRKKIYRSNETLDYNIFITPFDCLENNEYAVTLASFYLCNDPLIALAHHKFGGKQLSIEHQDFHNQFIINCGKEFTLTDYEKRKKRGKLEKNIKQKLSEYFDRVADFEKDYAEELVLLLEDQKKQYIQTSNKNPNKAKIITENNIIENAVASFIDSPETEAFDQTGTIDYFLENSKSSHPTKNKFPNIFGILLILVLVIFYKKYEDRYKSQKHST